MTNHAAHRFTAVVSQLAAAQKSQRNAPAYSRWINRPLGRRFAAAAFLLGLTPNQVTAMSAGFTSAAIALLVLAPPTAASGLAVSALLVLGYALDSADGQLARLKGGGSPLGEWLDHLVDSVKNISVHLGVLVSWYRFDTVTHEFGATSEASSGTWLLAVPLAYAVVANTFFFGMTLTDQLRRQERSSRRGPTPSGSRAERAPALASLMTLPNDFGLLCLVFATFGLPQLFVPLYALLFVANSLFLAVGVGRWSRELRQARQDR